MTEFSLVKNFGIEIRAKIQRKNAGANIEDLVDALGEIKDLLFEWQWDEENHVYVDPDTGEVIEHDTLIEYRNSITGGAADIYAEWPVEEEEEPDERNWLALLLLGLISLTVWELGMRQAITATVVTQYSLGRGGFVNMGNGDWDEVDAILLTQFQFLNAFFNRHIAWRTERGTNRGTVQALFCGHRAGFRDR